MYMHKLARQVVCTYDEPVVETKYGKLRGMKVDGSYIFRGVKYADAKRFHPAEEVKPWTGNRDALSYGPVCAELNTPVPHDESYVPHFFYPQSEHCQYLNIWTPSTDRNAKKPVMVWLHGGGWFAGSSLEIFSYDGENLSAFGDVVVVSLNHRLNVLGFLNLSAYGDEYADSANLGLLDLVAALKWIRENIEGFGGDPNNVTIFGQSGGGSKVVSLMQTPAADGLFHKAIMQSGGNMAMEVPEETTRRYTDLLLGYLGLGRDTVRAIEDVHFYDLADAAAKAIFTINHAGGPRYDFAPLANGKTFLGHPFTSGFRRETSHIPMLMGSVLGEFSHNYDIRLGEGSKNNWSEAYTAEIARQRFGESSDTLLELFKKAYPGRNPADLLFMDHTKRRTFRQLSQLRAAGGGAPVYNWLFNLESPFFNGTVAWHNAEEPYVFHNAQFIETAYIPGVSEKLQDQMSGAWVSFARTGNPNHAGLPQWLPVTPESLPTMVFDRTCELKTDHDRELIGQIPAVPWVFPGTGLMKAIFGIEPEA